MTNNVRDEIVNWNLNFPYDRLWRKKYNIAYNSSGHREVSFLDQLFDLEEDKLFKELADSEKYEPNMGDWLKPQEQKSQEDSITALKNEFKDLKDE